MGKDRPSISREEIWEEWKNPSPGSPCYDCDRRDKHQVSKPYYGHGDPGAEVILLGADPGGNSSVVNDPSIWYNYKRFWKNYPGTEKEIENIQSTDEKGFSGIDYVKETIPDLKGIINKLQNRNVSVYYTNVAKCNHINSVEGEDDIEIPNDVDTEVEDRKELNRRGKKNCATNFLIEEINYVDPDAIISLADGGHIKYIFEFFGLDLPSGSRVQDYVWKSTSQDAKNATDVIPSQYSERARTTIIPAYHFTLLGRNISRFLNNDGESLYYSELSPPEKGGKDWYYDLVANRAAELVG